MTDTLKGKAAVVTGAGRGIGRGIALLLAQEGASVVVNDLGGAVDGSGASQSPADEVVAEIKAAGGNAVANYESVATMEGGERIIQSCVDNFGKIDILVCVAGILRDRMVFNMTEEEWDDVIAVHLKGTFTCVKHAAILMRQQRGGRIVCFSSTSGLFGNSGQANYGAAKDGIAGIVRCVSQDLGKYGVTCNGISPSAATRMTLTEEVRKAREIRAAAGQAGHRRRKARPPRGHRPRRRLPLHRPGPELQRRDPPRRRRFRRPHEPPRRGQRPLQAVGPLDLRRDRPGVPGGHRRRPGQPRPAPAPQAVARPHRQTQKGRRP